MKPTTTVILADGKELTLELLPLRSFGELLLALQDTVIDIFNQFQELNEDQILERLPQLIADNIDDVAKIIEIGTRGAITAKEAADERGLADAITIITALLQVNDVKQIVGAIKKAIAAYKPTDAATTDTPANR